MTFGSVFAGIGGFDLGFERAGLQCKWQVEIDPYCRRVLERHWPDVERHDDVRTFEPGERHAVDVVCGGFPCQDLSVAGKGAGIDGERSGLWSELARIIGLVRPRYAVVENVPALLGRGMGRVLGDLAAIGYDAEWDCIPAGAFGAHFIGDRLFIIATRSEAGSVRPQGCWPTPVRANQWGEHEFAGLVRVEAEHGIPAGSHGRVSDGISNRSHRLRALGNAIVPQVAEWIGRRLTQ